MTNDSVAEDATGGKGADDMLDGSSGAGVNVGEMAKEAFFWAGSTLAVFGVFAVGFGLLVWLTPVGLNPFSVGLGLVSYGVLAGANEVDNMLVNPAAWITVAVSLILGGVLIASTFG